MRFPWQRRTCRSKYGCFCSSLQVTYLHTKNEAGGGGGGLKIFISKFASLSWRIALKLKLVAQCRPHSLLSQWWNHLLRRKNQRQAESCGKAAKWSREDVWHVSVARWCLEWIFERQQNGHEYQCLPPACWSISRHGTATKNFMVNWILLILRSAVSELMCGFWTVCVVIELLNWTENKSSNIKVYSR